MANILVVDPIPSTLTDLGTVLRAKGHDVRLASSGARGYDLFCRWNPEVMILNPVLGDMDGAQLLQRIREREPHAAVILYVDERDPKPHTAIRREDVTAIVKKEFSLHNLGAALTSALHNVKRGAPMDSRKGERFEVRVLTDVLREVMVQSDSEAHGLILDLSARGCRVCGHPLVKKGDYIALSVKLGGQSEPVNIELASVRWVGANDFGVEFIRVSQRDQQRLRAYAEVSGSYRVLPSDPPVGDGASHGAMAVKR
jgi:DNA-binding response OmpR family regulator